jgi:hypothetical protein
VSRTPVSRNPVSRTPVSRWCDVPGEMPGDTFTDEDALSERAVEAVLAGRAPDPDLQPLAELVHDLRSVADRADPQPNAALASVLSTGLSTEKGDLLVTAGSNVIGPATTQAAGLPKWRNRTRMLPAGLLSSMVAKVVAGVVSGLVGVTGLGAAGALPGPAQDAVANVVNTVTPFNLPTGGGAAVTSSLPVPGVDVTVSTADTTTSVAAGGSGPAPAASAAASAQANGGPTTPSGTAAGTAAGNLPIPACVSEIVDVNTGQPKVPLSQVSTKVVQCVKTLMATSGAAMPAGVSRCVESILAMVAGAAPGPNVTAPGPGRNVAGLDVSTCVPVDVTRCMSSVMGMVQNLPGLSAGAGGGFNVPSFDNLDLTGCMPFNLDACLSSLLSMAGNLPNVGTGGIPGLGAGTVPSAGSLNLSTCVPFGSLPSVPGLGFLSGFLPR